MFHRVEIAFLILPIQRMVRIRLDLFGFFARRFSRFPATEDASAAFNGIVKTY